MRSMALGVAVVLSIVAGPSYAVTIDWFSTGLSDARTSLADDATDPHYLVEWSTGPGSSFSTNATVLSPGHPAWFNPENNGLDARWIGVSDWNVSDGEDVLYRFSTTFDLTGFDVETALFSFSYASDNTSVVTLNGTEISRRDAAQSFRNLVSYEYDTAANLLVAGQNTLAFDVFNIANGGRGNPMGLLVTGLGGTVAPIPVPLPGILLLSALCCLAVLRMKSRINQDLGLSIQSCRQA